MIKNAKKEPGLPNHFLFSSDNRGLSEELNAAAKSLTEKINSTVGRLEEKEATAEKDGDKAREALQKANKAQHKATDSSKKVIMAQKELQEISAILSTVEEPGRLLTKHIFILFWVKSYTDQSLSQDKLHLNLIDGAYAWEITRSFFGI